MKASKPGPKGSGTEGKKPVAEGLGISCREDMLARIKSLNEAPRGRGRPPADTLNDIDTGMRGVAAAVFRYEFIAGSRRGSKAAAIRKVAAEKDMDEHIVKQAAKLYRRTELFELLRVHHKQQEDFRELQHRMRGFPDNMRMAVAQFSAMRFLKLLRETDVDGECPSWLVELVTDELMTPK